MRIAINLEFCQSAPDAAPVRAAIAQVHALLDAARAHDVTLLLNEQHAGAIEALRLAFGAHLPRAKMRTFRLPAQANLAGLVRENAVAALGADAVFVPLAPGPLLESPLFASVHGQPGASGAALLQALEQAVVTHAGNTPPARPRLAYVSPLPPEKSGIADYSAELVPQLARFYDVELILGQDRVDDDRVNALPQHTAAWFAEHGHEFDRIVYHFGNSHAHQHMFELIRRHPGIVVLHDFFFSGVLDNLEREGYLPQAFLGALYESHGYSGLLDHRKAGRNPSIWVYPLNKGVLDNASGVIVHSDFSKQLATDWYGPGAADGWRTVPLLRGKPAASDGPGQRAAARGRLGLGPDDYLVCSFGMLGRTKLNEELLDAFLASPLAADPTCRLVFVGENEPGLYGAGLKQKIAASAARERIAITGFATAAAYADYLAACDTAVQLRSATRGETSAAVLDCLLYGAPTIVNAHGSTASIDDTLLLMLPDDFSVGQLAEALVRLHGDAGLRADLSACALAHMQAEHAPAHVGQLMHEAIEEFAAHHPHAHYRALVQAIGAKASMPAGPQLAELAATIALNQPAPGPRQLLVDVSAVIQSDLKTGIQRVVRSVLLALIADPPKGFRIEPVFSVGGNRPYHYARRFALELVGETGLALEDAPAELRPGDVFFGLDLFTNGTTQNQPQLQTMRDRGLEIYFVVFDILPMLRPEVFPFGTEQYFGDFLRTAVTVADGLLCISRAVADELSGWIDAQPRLRQAPLKVGYFHLGADIDASAPSFGLPPHAQLVFDAVAARPSFLMVGTVEPRKGHTQSLDAFELLWQQGADINLVIVGKQGWMMEQLVERMASHPEKDIRLFWLPGVSDEMLLKLYASCAALLAPSEGEGFGLPLIEAAQHHIPVIARSLPVFREVAGEHAYYFEGKEPAALAATVTAWLALRQQGKAPPSDAMPWLSWSDSARQVRAAIVDQQWYRELPGV